MSNPRWRRNASGRGSGRRFGNALFSPRSRPGAPCMLRFGPRGAGRIGAGALCATRLLVQCVQRLCAQIIAAAVRQFFVHRFGQVEPGRVKVQS